MSKSSVKNIFITGAIGVGKSTLLGRIITDLGLSCSGFLTLPYHIEGKRRGFYLHALAGIPDEQNDVPITAQPNGNSFYAIDEAFEDFGSRVLDAAACHSSDVIIMDEIGKAEGNCRNFISSIQSCLDSDKMVLGVLRQANCPHIDRIKNRQDTAVFVLERDKLDLIYTEIAALIKKEKMH